MILGIHITVTVGIDPPASSKIAGIARSILGLWLSIDNFQFLESTLRWQRVDGSISIIVHILVDHVDHTGGALVPVFHRLPRQVQP